MSVWMRRSLLIVAGAVLVSPVLYMASPKPVAGWYYAPAISDRMTTYIRFSERRIERHVRSEGGWTSTVIGAWGTDGDGALVLRLDERGRDFFPARFSWPNNELVCGFGASPAGPEAVAFHRMPEPLIWIFGP